jgi:hypothetical protein
VVEGRLVVLRKQNLRVGVKRRVDTMALVAVEDIPVWGPLGVVVVAAVEANIMAPVVWVVVVVESEVAGGGGR